ncbi:MAG: hypothetical protein HPY83_09865 [Anaerolineae bacterium]|nr:hypothetical protein [Anaerolineae bacterium]
MSPASTTTAELPSHLRELFWDYDFEALSWEEDQDLIIGRNLAAGNWDAITWLRSLAGDGAIRRWLEEHRGGGLSPRQLRFWQLILRLPRHQVDAWVEGRQTWDRRMER